MEAHSTARQQLIWPVCQEASLLGLMLFNESSVWQKWGQFSSIEKIGCWSDFSPAKKFDNGNARKDAKNLKVLSKSWILEELTFVFLKMPLLVYSLKKINSTFQRMIANWKLQSGSLWHPSHNSSTRSITAPQFFKGSKTLNLFW